MQAADDQGCVRGRSGRAPVAGGRSRQRAAGARRQRCNRRLLPRMHPAPLPCLTLVRTSSTVPLYLSQLIKLTFVGCPTDMLCLGHAHIPYLQLRMAQGPEQYLPSAPTLHSAQGQTASVSWYFVPHNLSLSLEAGLKAGGAGRPQNGPAPAGPGLLQHIVFTISYQYLASYFGHDQLFAILNLNVPEYRPISMSSPRTMFLSKCRPVGDQQGGTTAARGAPREWEARAYSSAPAAAVTLDWVASSGRIDD